MSRPLKPTGWRRLALPRLASRNYTSRQLARETDEALLDRLGTRRPQEMLLKQLEGMIQCHGANTGLPCFGRDSLLDWLALQQASLAGLGGQSKRSSTEVAIKELPGQHVVDNTGQEVAAASGVVLVRLPDETPQYVCQVCGQCFVTLHQVKTHEGRFHQQFAPQREMSNKADYSVGGLPQCRFCRQSFSRWTALQSHIRNNRCPGLRSPQTEQVVNAGPSDVPSLATYTRSSNGALCCNFRRLGAGNRL